MIVPSFRLLVGFERAMGYVDDRLGGFTMIEEQYVGTVLRVECGRYGRHTIDTAHKKVKTPMTDVADVCGNDEIVTTVSHKSLIGKTCNTGGDIGCYASAHHGVGGSVDDGVAIVATIEDGVLRTYGNGGELLTCRKSMQSYVRNTGG